MSTVFISYAHDTEAHRAKVLDLSHRLRREGVDASVDAYEPHPWQGWQKWMESQFRLDFVIAILSPKFIKDFNQEIGSPSGARYEGTMLSSSVFREGFKRIAIVCFSDWPGLDIPLVLDGCTRYFLDKPGEYEKLYAFLTSQTLIEKPPLGSVVVLRTAARLLPVDLDRSFASLCKLLWPLMEENRRIFEDFGPNSGAANSGSIQKKVRYDLALWKSKRLAIGTNNEAIAEYLHSHAEVIPGAHAPLFRQWLSHI